MFRDRHEAGQRLALELAKLTLQDPVVLALPRGGVPVAAEVAKALKAPLDLILVRKVGSPGNPELAVAAIVDGDPPDVVLNREIVEAYFLDDDALRVEFASRARERAKAFRWKDNVERLIATARRAPGPPDPEDSGHTAVPMAGVVPCLAFLARLPS